MAGTRLSTPIEKDTSTSEDKKERIVGARLAAIPWFHSQAAVMVFYGFEEPIRRSLRKDKKKTSSSSSSYKANTVMEGETKQEV